ncbi:hypothetical protein [Streptomyces sp. YGL11-2]|uniref:hypothetical protein n=1 Tax=Streptomyces sp. YGL11-2 TaxID=3414028 RepID=UPI003CF6F57A
MLSTFASGTAIAAPQKAAANQQAKPGTAIAKGFFKPDAHTVVKRNVPKQMPKQSLAGLKSSPDNQISGPVEVCGTDTLDKTSGQGKGTLVMTVEKSVKTALNGEFGLSNDDLSAKLGFSVEDSVTVKDEHRYDVPAGKTGFIVAHPTYDQYTVTTFGKAGFVMKPTGVCFQSWSS